MLVLVKIPGDIKMTKPIPNPVIQRMMASKTNSPIPINAPAAGRDKPNNFDSLAFL